MKIRAVVSFNECYDGLYGTCNNGEKKYNKDQASDNLPECKTTDKVGSQAHDMHDYTGTAKAPEYGRSQVVLKNLKLHSLPRSDSSRKLSIRCMTNILLLRTKLI